MSNPAYSPRAGFAVGDLISRLRIFARQTNHEFWPDDISLRDEKVIDVERIHGSRQITDLYQLALAVKHKGKLRHSTRVFPLPFFIPQEPGI